MLLHIIFVTFLASTGSLSRCLRQGSQSTNNQHFVDLIGHGTQHIKTLIERFGIMLSWSSAELRQTSRRRKWRFIEMRRHALRFHLALSLLLGCHAGLRFVFLPFKSALGVDAALVP